VLDELDAPLDESNINRFLDVLRGFLDLSQFIVITHNKRTIAMADVLYGVTMQERGISKILSMRFNSEPRPAPPRQLDLPALASAESPVETPSESPSAPEDQEMVMAK
jgi:chromosome segregation protein